MLSFVNTQLRDNYSGLKELAAAYDIDEKELCDKLAQIDYKYVSDNQIDLESMWKEINGLQTQVEYIAVSNDYFEISV